MSATPILIATIGRPHGVRGLVRLHAATATPDAVEALGGLRDGQGRVWHVRWRGVGIAEIRDANGVAITDRDAAARLVNLELFAERDALPETDEDEFYHADLIGMAAFDPDGASLGTVSIVHDYGAGVSLELRGARPIIVPFTRACVPEIDLAGRRITVVEPDEIELEGDLQVTGGQAGGDLVSWDAHVLTLFPDMFPGPLAYSLAGRALERGAWSCTATDLRDFGLGRHRAVDDTPFGGGAGMVMRPDVVDAAIGSLGTDARPVLYPTPRGRRLTQEDVRRHVAGPGVVVLCGRFEGIDERVLQARGIEEVCLGDFVLSGGEIAALALLDACVRLLPGVMGSDESGLDESFSDGLLEYPHYTRPATWQGRDVPEILLSGNHAAIAAWRHDQARAATAARRPDLWTAYQTRHQASAARGGASADLGL